MQPFFVISLDFELFWGVRDKKVLPEYGQNILGARQAIPEMLRLFKVHNVHTTWATVGMLLFDNKKDLINALPAVKPTYQKSWLSPYEHIKCIGDTEKEDPYHYGLSIARMIADVEDMEIASHTFSHYYCLENGQNAVSFKADLDASINATQRLGVTPVSLVFPRNQYNIEYLPICEQLGFISFRGNEAHWIYRGTADQGQGHIRRAARLLDSYVNISGSNGFIPSTVNNIVNVPSSRFLRPFNPKLRHLEYIRIERIKSAMTQAAANKMGFHLWWHPHNFGTDLRDNMENLNNIVAHFVSLRERYDVRSLTMREVAEPNEPIKKHSDSWR